MPAATQVAVTQTTMNGARRQALCCSGLQPSDAPAAAMVATAIGRAVQQFGTGGCAAGMAQAFGDHPDTAVERMRWARQLAARASAWDLLTGPSAIGLAISLTPAGPQPRDINDVRNAWLPA